MNLLAGGDGGAARRRDPLSNRVALARPKIGSCIANPTRAVAVAALASDRLMIRRAEPLSKSSATKLLRTRGEGDRIECAVARPLPFTWRGAALIGRKCLRLD